LFIIPLRLVVHSKSGSTSLNDVWQLTGSYRKRYMKNQGFIKFLVPEDFT